MAVEIIDHEVEMAVYDDEREEDGGDLMETARERIDVDGKRNGVALSL